MVNLVTISFTLARLNNQSEGHHRHARAHLRTKENPGAVQLQLTHRISTNTLTRELGNSPIRKRGSTEQRVNASTAEK
jgi:hypothetical protein